uniref:DnaJ homolog subfamily C member 13 n=1 Tax=Cacopsylla melanoneura TaxID=428564 RepID=A0A8D8SG75_9HEMI
MCIDGYYLRILLESSSQDLGIRSPLTFFNNLYHRFLLTQRLDMKCQCLQAMSIVYNQYSEVIGLFPDIRYIIVMLSRTQDKLERDRLLIFLDKLLSYKENIKIFLDENGISVLVDLVTLAHLHVTRARHVIQSNVLEAAAGANNALEDQEKEWYYGTSEQSKGPVSFGQMKQLWAAGELNPKTKVWAHGMEGWKSLHQVTQLKWTLVAKNSGGVMNETELSSLILSMLIKITRCYPTRDEDGAVIWPLPKVKRCLSQATVLPHLVQLLLTFDPGLVELVATLLCEIVVDNALARKLYLTGVFFFILMYTGSNVLPIARFLQLTHTAQAFMSDTLTSSDLMKRSILGPLLPEAMLYYLENHGADKFAQIFLGEFDTPEAIWSGDMRRHLIGKIAAHLADFTPRLAGNNRAVYQFCGIPAVRYPQLESEMFVNVFYLRHLCDATRFPDWPISHPVQLLKEVLEAWTSEVERKPPEMTADDAYQSLGLTRGSHHEENVVRKAYYKIASQYHPDKNPGGRDIFVRANKAYDFLCSRTCWENNEPNPNNIVLVLRTQSILFHRYSEELSGYKYAGYRQLIATIRAETSDENETLFSSAGSLLGAAVELAYHTVQCSALNAQELNNEGGFQCLHVAFTRCLSVLTHSLSGSEMPVQVCSYVAKCYTVAAQFTGCRVTFCSMSPSLLSDLAYTLRSCLIYVTKPVLEPPIRPSVHATLLSDIRY